MRLELKGNLNKRIKVTVSADTHTSMADCDAFLITFELFLKQTYQLQSIERFTTKDDKIVILGK